LHLIKINCLSLWLDGSAHAWTRSELRGASCEDWNCALIDFFELITILAKSWRENFKHAPSKISSPSKSTEKVHSSKIWTHTFGSLIRQFIYLLNYQSNDWRRVLSNAIHVSLVVPKVRVQITLRLQSITFSVDFGSVRNHVWNFFFLASAWWYISTYHWNEYNWNATSR
jgi:hypothetical protein